MLRIGVPRQKVNVSESSEACNIDTHNMHVRVKISMIFFLVFWVTFKKGNELGREGRKRKSLVSM